MKVSQKSEKVWLSAVPRGVGRPNSLCLLERRTQERTNTADGREEGKNKYTTLLVRLRMCVLMNHVVKGKGPFHNYYNIEII